MYDINAWNIQIMNELMLHDSISKLWDDDGCPMRKKYNRVQTRYNEPTWLLYKKTRCPFSQEIFFIQMNFQTMFFVICDNKYL